MNAQQVVEHFLDRVMARDLPAAEAYLTDDFVFSPEADLKFSREVLMQTFKALFAGMPDWTFRLRDINAEGSRVTMRASAQGTHTGTFAYPADGFPVVPATGRRITLPEYTHNYVVDGQRIRSLHFDMVPGGGMVDIVRQMGAELAL